MKKLLIAGCGGLGAEALWVANAMGEWECIGFADDDPSKGSEAHGLPVVGGITAASESLEPGWVYCALGNNNTRAKVLEKFLLLGWTPATLVHPSVIVGPGVVIGPGTYVAPGSVLCPNAKTGKGVLINCHVTIGHDSIMGDYSQACPGARINGNCRVGDYAFLGSNCSLRPGTTLAPRVTVGANSLVIRDVKEGMVIGVPAKSM